MILGIGCDMIEIGRIKRAIEKKRFLQRFFTEKEQAFFSVRKFSLETIAGSFAAKEAVVKAMGCGFASAAAESIEILRNSRGMPTVCLYANALETQRALKIQKFHLSISHTKEYAMAYAIAEGDVTDEAYSGAGDAAN